MKTLLTTLNSKYIHVAAAIHYLRAYAEAHGFNPDVEEFTINQDMGWVLGRIVKTDADLVGFSCNIWNVGETKQLIRWLKKVRPEIRVLVGGPEFSCDPRGFMADCPADFGIIGEGERPFLSLLQNVGGQKWEEGIPGLVRRDPESGRIRVELPAEEPIGLDEIPFPYTDRVLAEPGRIFYYETSRGCPFACTYCLSGTERGLRYRRLESVFADLDRLAAARVRQVKFIDRTFNADPSRAVRILEYIMERHAQAATNFHMEFVAELLDKPLLDLLAQAPPGLFRTEVGIQSLHPPTLKAVRRRSNPERLEENLRALMAPDNLPVHLDLIAGLPYEDWKAFGRTFDWTYRLRPQEIQLGILKMLKGSELGQDGVDLGYRWTDEAPYEILSTPWLSFEAMQRLKTMAHLVDVFYNTGHFARAIPFFWGGGRSAFGMLDRMAEGWVRRGLDEFQPGLRLQFEFLRDSAPEWLPEEETRRVFIDLLRLDRALGDWGQEGGDGWGDPPDLPTEWREMLNNQDWVGRFLPELGMLKPGDRSRRVRRLKLSVDPRAPENGSRATEVILFRPLTGRTGYRIYEPNKEFQTGRGRDV